MSYNDTFLQEIMIACKKLIVAGDSLVVGLSGGPDSVFLLHMLVQLKEQMPFTLVAVHLNHEWRDTAAADAAFCAHLCAQLNVPLISKKISELSFTSKYNGSKEEVARKARRFFFEQITKEHNATAIALAHHAQDQQETFFIRLLRGTSLSGMIGMKKRDGLYIRPLLSINKQQILEHLHTHAIAYCTDETNESSAFLRNRIRAKVIPALKDADNRFDDAFVKTLNHLQNTEDFLQEYTTTLFKQMVTHEGDHFYLPCHELKQLHPTIKQRIIIMWLCAYQVPFAVSEAFFNELIRFLEHDNAKTHQMNNSWCVEKFSDKALIRNS